MSPECKVERPPASRAQGPRPSVWPKRLALWVAVVAAFGLALIYDVPLMRLRYDLLPRGPRGFLREVLFGCRDFGQLVAIVVGAIIVLRCDRRGLRAVGAILLAQVLAGIVYNSGKLTIARQRPHVAVAAAAAESPEPLPDGEASRYGLAALEMSDTWLGVAHIKTDYTTQSFPSGHSAASFAFAGVLSVLYPRLAILFWTLAVGCAFSRFAEAVHWMSDCIAGASIGYIAAWLSVRWTGVTPAQLPPAETNSSAAKCA